ncbi:MAG: GtrA family protein [Pseudomonadota bacterium]
MLETSRGSKATLGVIGGCFAPHTLAGRFVRYAFASASGTVIDLLAFALLVWGGLGLGLAAASGYALGTVWHWQVTSRRVFPDRLADRGEPRRRQQAMFFASAGLGLALTLCIVKIGVWQGLAPSSAKFAAMCASFASVWLVRLLFVFAEDRG